MIAYRDEITLKKNFVRTTTFKSSFLIRLWICGINYHYQYVRHLKFPALPRVQGTSCHQDMTEFLILHSCTLFQFGWLLFISYWMFLIYIYYRLLLFFLLEGLRLYGVHDSFVDYPNDDVVYCNWTAINNFID